MVSYHLDAERTKRSSGTDTRAQQNGGAVNRAGRDHYFVCRDERAPLCVHALDADRAPILDDHAIDQRVAAHFEIRTGTRGLEIRDCRGYALAVTAIHRKRPDAFGNTVVVVVHRRNPDLDTRVMECPLLRRPLVWLPSRDRDRPRAPVYGVSALGIGFEATKHRQQIGPTPTRVPGGGPRVDVLR